MDVPARVRFAVEVSDPGPDDRILEIGCGPGVAAALVCARLTTGRLLAIDRSEIATRRTTRRCAEHVAAGRLEVRTGPLDTLDVPDGSFDAAFSIDVNLFWLRRPGQGSPARETALLARALRPGGVLHVCCGADGPRTGERVTTPVADALRAAGFVDVDVRAGDGGLAVSGRVGRW